MPDLEELIRNTLDRQAPRPDPDPIVQRVAQRKRQVRTMRRVQSATLAVVVVAGIAAGGYALARAFGVGAHRPSPAASTTLPAPSVTPTIGTCGDGPVTLGTASQGGAAGTIRTVWRLHNGSNAFQGTPLPACRSFGYPSIDVHGPTGWLGVRVLHEGYPDIDEPPAHVLVQPGGSLYFVTYWSDATTNAGACVLFDRVRVTLPGSSTVLEIASTGCIGPEQVRVGPVSAALPQA